MTRSTIAKTYIDTEPDYLAVFGQLWIGFNTWYNDRSSAEPELNRILDACSGSAIEAKFDNQMNSLSAVDPFLTDTVDDLAKWECGTHVQYHDTSGFKLRLACNGTTDVIEFLLRASRMRRFAPQCAGLKFFNNVSRVDPLFKCLYLKYKRHMATEQQMVNPYNAMDIVNQLDRIGVEHHGRLLYHDLRIRSAGSSSLYSLSDVFGPSYQGLCTRLHGISSNPAAIQTVGRGSRYESYKVRGQSLFRRYLTVLYKFRSAYFHGDLNKKDVGVQQTAKLAFYGLKSVCRDVT